MINEDLVTVATFRDYIQANVAKTKLQSEGIECWLADDFIITLQWLYSLAFGGVKLKVRESDRGHAHAILEQGHRRVTDEIVSLQEVGPRLFFAHAIRRWVFLVLAASYIVPLILQIAYFLGLVGPGVQSALLFLSL